MGIRAGIVGLPNVGKSTLFNALSSGGAESANFPFCTIEPNVGIVPVPDPRLSTLATIFGSETVIPTSLEFVDIAGLVKGASEGEGLGNQFLGHIQSVDAILHVVRCFEDENIVHVEGGVDPIHDVEVIDTELALRDLDTVQKRLTKTLKQTKATGKAGEQARMETEILNRFVSALDAGQPVRALDLSDTDAALLSELHLLTAKPVLYVANIAESDVGDPDAVPYIAKLRALAAKTGTEVVPICAGIEAEVAELPEEERQEFLESVCLKEPGLHKIIRVAYELLGLLTFLTAGPKESRAWTVVRGAKAPQAAGVIHTDFERGFIKAEVMNIADLQTLKSEAAVKSAGKMRIEGKNYTVADGDVMHFRFNV